ncbi:hypothetical protein SAY87_027918 [Trapa incisa]|uniref:Dirigent protein n=1 Tax=Trapa incisa TaxID=236973 RepID=A0AAN7KUN1_9MYRT|nr:hypothetical protein SAY87_027918 [Trapa incisa]
MASSLAKVTLFITFLFCALSNHEAVAGGNSEDTPSLEDLRLLLKSQKLTRLNFYMHDLVLVSDPTSVRVAGVPGSNGNTTNFGDLYVLDDPLTTGPSLTSRAVGRAQGIYSFSSEDATALMMSINMIFTGDKYNGSTVAVIGRNDVLKKVRELPVVGGTGAFRLARGFLQITTAVLDSPTLSVVLNCSLYVLH